MNEKSHVESEDDQVIEETQIDSAQSESTTDSIATNSGQDTSDEHKSEMFAEEQHQLEEISPASTENSEQTISEEKNLEHNPHRSRLIVVLLAAAIITTVCAASWEVVSPVSDSPDPSAGAGGLNPANGDKRPINADHQGQSITAYGTIFRKTVSQHRGKVLAGILGLLATVVVVTIVAVVILKSKKSPVLPVSTLDTNDTGAAPADIFQLVSRSPVLAKILLAITVLSVAASFFLRFVPKAPLSKFKLESLGAIIILISSLTGIWQLGVFSNISLIIILQSPAAVYLLIAAVVLVLHVVAGYLATSNRSGTQNVLIYQFKKNAPLLLVCFYFGALGTIGGAAAGIVASIFGVLLLGSLGYEVYVNQSRGNAGGRRGHVLAALRAVLVVAAIVSVFIGSSTGLHPFIISLFIPAVMILSDVVRLSK